MIADIGSNKLTVVGKVDPVRIRDCVEKKTRKKVELLSPPPKKNNENKKDENKSKEVCLYLIISKFLWCFILDLLFFKFSFAASGVDCSVQDPAALRRLHPANPEENLGNQR